MPEEPLKAHEVLDAAAAAPEGITLHFKGGYREVPMDDDTWKRVFISAPEARRDFQIKLSVCRRAEQKRLALGIEKFEDLLTLTGWENIVTRSLPGDRLWVGVQTKADYGIERINGMNGGEK